MGLWIENPSPLTPSPHRPSKSPLTPSPLTPRLALATSLCFSPQPLTPNPFEDIHQVHGQQPLQNVSKGGVEKARSSLHCRYG